MEQQQNHDEERMDARCALAGLGGFFLLQLILPLIAAVLNMRGPARMLFLQIPMHAGMIVLAVCCAKKYCPGRPVAEVLRLRRTERFSYGRTFRRFLEMLAVILALNFLVDAVCRWLKWDLPGQILVQQAQEGSSAEFLVIMLPAILLAPVSEELLFRGALFRFFRTLVPGWQAMIFSALIFAAFHWNVRYFLPLFGMGLMLQTVYQESGTLRSSILLHILNNLTTALFLLRMRLFGTLF